MCVRVPAAMTWAEFRGGIIDPWADADPDYDPASVSGWQLDGAALSSDGRGLAGRCRRRAQVVDHVPDLTAPDLGPDTGVGDATAPPDADGAVVRRATSRRNHERDVHRDGRAARAGGRVPLRPVDPGRLPARGCLPAARLHPRHLRHLQAASARGRHRAQRRVGLRPDGVRAQRGHGAGVRGDAQLRRHGGGRRRSGARRGPPPGAGLHRHRGRDRGHRAGDPQADRSTSTRR